METAAAAGARVIQTSPSPHSTVHHPNPNKTLTVFSRSRLVELRSCSSRSPPLSPSPLSPNRHQQPTSPSASRDRRNGGGIRRRRRPSSCWLPSRLRVRAYASKPQEGDSGEIRRLLSSAMRDCVPQARSSFVAFQASTGMEVCTFPLIVKNAASLLDGSDPEKLKAEIRLDDLIRSFSFLDTTIDTSDLRPTTDGEKVKNGLMDSISALDKFKQGIKDCLGV